MNVHSIVCIDVQKCLRMWSDLVEKMAYLAEMSDYIALLYFVSLLVAMGVCQEH